MFSTRCLIIGMLLIHRTVGHLAPTTAGQHPALYLVAGYLLGRRGFGFIQIGLPNDAGIVERGKS